MAESTDQVGAGRYALTGMLGEGGMGTVYRAVDRLTGAEVAVKRLAVRSRPGVTLPAVAPPRGEIGGEIGGAPGGEVGTAVTDPAFDTAGHTLAATPAARAAVAERGDEAPTRQERPSPSPRPDGDSALAMRLAIATEFRILASLRHPSIISVLDYGFDDERRPFLVLELLEDARPITTAARGLPLAARVAFIAQMLQALDYLHRRGIRHRDLKPSNVLVADGRVRVLDFGLALESGEHHRPAGTLGYIAPEVMRGEPHTVAADLYAAGIVAYELLAGHHPFGRSEEDLLRASGLPPTLTLHDPSLPAAASAALVDTVERLLAHAPERRPSSAAQALRLLARTGVLGEGEDADAQRSLVAAARLVGRTRERAQLREALARARRGHGGVVAVTGDSGVGKSRLIDDLRTHALVTGFAVMVGGEVAAGGGAYQAWQEPVRLLALEAAPGAAVPWPLLALVVPDVGELIGAGPLAPPPMDPQTLQVMLFGAVEALVRAARGPTLILLEDLHWAGPESLALLGAMTRVAAQAPLLVVATARTEAAAAVRGPGVEVVALAPLERRELAELATAVLGPLGDRADLVELLHHGTGGVPLYVVEALRLLASQAGGLDRIATMRLPPALTVAQLEQARRDRLARLPGDVLPLCELAAIAGRELDLEMLAALGPGAGLAAMLGAAEHAGVVDADVGGWRFTHDRVREVLVEGIAPARRAELHRRVAGWLDARRRDPVALAWHWGQAGDRAREAAWAAAAGESLLTRAAYPRARIAFERALALLDDRGLAGAERDRAELALQLGRGTCALILDGFGSPATAAAYDRAAALCESLGVAGGAQAFAVLFGQAAVHLFRGDITSSLRLAERALEIARDAGDVDLELEGRFALSNAQFWAGDLAGCEENVQRVLALWSDARAPLHAERFGQVPRITCMTGGAWGAWASGRPELARQRADEAVALARELGHGFTEAIAIQVGTFLAALRRDVEATLEGSETLIRLGAPFPAYMILARTLRAWALAHRERDRRYLDEMRAVWAEWQAIGQGAGHTLITGLLADALLLFAEPAEALAVAREGVAWSEARNERPLRADLLCLEGRALSAQGAPAAARAALAAARRDAQALGADTLVLRVAVATAALDLDAGDRVSARAVLVPAFERVRDGGDTVDLRRARALLARLEERPT